MQLADTNWPTTDDAPPPLSANSMLDTIVDSSQTVPQRTQTASPPASCQSMSMDPHSGFGHFIAEL